MMLAGGFQVGELLLDRAVVDAGDAFEKPNDYVSADPFVAYNLSFDCIK